MANNARKMKELVILIYYFNSNVIGYICWFLLTKFKNLYTVPQSIFYLSLMILKVNTYHFL
jgi:hypothetical protein